MPVSQSKIPEFMNVTICGTLEQTLTATGKFYLYINLCLLICILFNVSVNTDTPWLMQFQITQFLSK